MSQFEFTYTRENIIADNPIEEVVRRYGVELKQSSGRLMGLCPIHKEKTPSFCVSPEKRVFNCFGCGAGGSVIDFVAKVEGISIGDAMAKLTPEHYKNSRPLSSPSREIKTQPIGQSVSNSTNQKTPLVVEKIYEYTDETGKPIFEVVRFNPKTFRQRHKDPNNPKADRDGWVWNMEGIRRVLYKLPKVLKAKIVWVVEGEKDADNLAQFGFVATCNVGGAGKWMDGYTESLAGKEIVLCGDSDEAGQKHVELVTQSLAGKVKSLRIVKLPQGCKDISDYIETLPKDKGADERAEILYNALVNDLPKLTKGINLPIYSMEEMEERYIAEIKENQNSLINLARWLPSFCKIRPLTAGEMMVILADTGVGKTMLMQNLALSCAPIPTLVFELELPDTLTFERFVAIGTKTEASEVYQMYRRGEKVNWERFGGRLNHVHVCPESGLSPDEIESYIVKSELKIGKKPKLVCVDYAQLIQSKKSKSRYERMSDAAEQLKVIAKRTKSVVVLLSQVGRNKSDESPEVGLHDGKDSGAIENSAGLILGAWRNAKDPKTMHVQVLKSTKGGAGLIVECNLNGETLTVTEKSKIDPRDIPI